MKTQIVVKLQIEGLHHWPGCPLDDVAFLRDLHRHVFHIEIHKSVTHADRDIEIILFKREVEAFVRSMQDENKSFGARSCEHIATEIFDEFDCDMVQVLEDNENGGRVTRDDVEKAFGKHIAEHIVKNTIAENENENE